MKHSKYIMRNKEAYMKRNRLFDPSKKEAIRRAYHEAGHAVIAFILDIKIKEARIIPKLQIPITPNVVGEVLCDPPNMTDPDIYNKLDTARLWAEKISMIKLAGMIAEKSVAGKYDRKMAKQDLDSVEELITTLATSSEEAVFYFKCLFERTKSIVESPIIIEGIRALATKLADKKVLSSRQVHLLLNKQNLWKDKKTMGTQLVPFKNVHLDYETIFDNCRTRLTAIRLIW